MPNMSRVINPHNQKVLSSSQTNKIRQYNWRNPASCPFDSKCLTRNIVHKAVLSTTTDSHTYYGSSEDFKFWYNKHTKSFGHQHCKNNTELFRLMWDLRKRNSL